MNYDILRFKHVSVRYGNRPALHDIHVRIPCNSLTAIVGPNGAGKSTLLKAVLGWQPLAAGEIRIGDSHAHHALPRIAYLPQRPEVDWDFPITVRAVVAQGRYPALGLFRRFSRQDHGIVERALQEMGLTEICDRQIKMLSGGQQQRVFLARALAQGADIFLLDEPFAGLDIQASEELARHLRSWEEQGRTVIAAVHELDLARRHFSHAVLLRTKLIASGPVESVLTDANITAAFRTARGEPPAASGATSPPGDAASPPPNGEHPKEPLGHSHQR